MKNQLEYGDREFPQLAKVFAGGLDGSRLLSSVESSARKLESLANVPDPATQRPAKAALAAYANLAQLIDELRAAAPVKG